MIRSVSFPFLDHFDRNFPGCVYSVFVIRAGLKRLET
jgi:hypothetical protein